MAAKFYGAVYSPASPELPFVAIIFGPHFELVSARTAPSIEAGEAMMATILTEHKAKVTRQRRKAKAKAKVAGRIKKKNAKRS